MMNRRLWGRSTWILEVFIFIFECAAYMYKVPCIADIERDYQETLEKCQRITVEDCRREKLEREGGGQNTETVCSADVSRDILN